MAYSMYGILSAQVATSNGLVGAVVIALFMSAALTFATSISLRCGFHLAKSRSLSKGSTLLIASGALCRVRNSRIIDNARKSYSSRCGIWHRSACHSSGTCVQNRTRLRETPKSVSQRLIA